jgi:hypothetical protein
MDNIIEARITSLEIWQRTIDIARAKEEVDRKHIDKRFDDIEEALDEIKQTAKWLNRTVWGGILIYAAQFVMNGGLTVLTAGAH